MTEKLTVKYFANNDFANGPVQASEDAAGYDLYAVEAKTLFPHLCSGLTTELRTAIPKGYYGKKFSSFWTFTRPFHNLRFWVVDADYRGTVVVLLINHSSEYYTTQVGDRIGQMVFMKKFDANFEEVAEPDLLGKTNDMGGFGSTGKSFIKLKEMLISWKHYTMKFWRMLKFLHCTKILIILHQITFFIQLAL